MTAPSVPTLHDAAEPETITTSPTAPTNGSSWTVGRGCEFDFNAGTLGDQQAIQAAIDRAFISVWKEVLIYGGTYSINRPTPLIPKSGVHLRGTGVDAVVFANIPASGWAILTEAGPGISNFIISDITFLLSGLNSSGIKLADVTDCRIERCNFRSTSDGGWHVIIGSSSSGRGIEPPYSNPTIMSHNVTIKDCIFGRHCSSAEQLLVFNANNTLVTGCRFQDNGSSTYLGVCLGLWQWTLNTRIENCDFLNNAADAIYYSITCHQTLVRDCYFENCKGAIQGANVSDNGAFGETRIKGLTLSNLCIVGGTNSHTSGAISIRAVDGYYIGGGTSITGYNVGIVLSNHNGDVQLPNPINGIISECRIFNNNAENTHPTLHPGIMISSVHNEVWQDHYNLIIANCEIFDSRVPKQQRYAIAFEGAFKTPIVGVRINNSRLSGAGGGASIIDHSGVNISGVGVVYPQDWTYSGTFPGKLVTFP